MSIKEIVKKTLLVVKDRLINQKITTSIGVLLIVAALFDSYQNERVVLLTLGTSLLTAKDSYFKMR